MGITMSTLPAERPQSRLTFRQKLSNFDFKASPYLYISPFFLLFALLGAFPIIYTVNVSLYNWDLLKGQGLSLIHI